MTIRTTGETLPIRCPRCRGDGATQVVRSYSVVTVRCVTCGYPWSVEITTLPKAAHERLQDVVTSADTGAGAENLTGQSTVHEAGAGGDARGQG